MFNILNEVTSSTQGFELFEEKVNPNSSWKALKIRGVFQRADSKNQNGRIYPYKVLDKAIQDVSESLMARNMFGELDHPSDQSPTVSLKNVSHVVTSLKFVGNELIGEAIVFDDPGPTGTPSGRVLGSLIRNNCTVGISSRGFGSVTEGYGETTVDDYKLVTFDCVHDPSTQKAFIQSVNEGADFERQLKMALERENFLKELRSEFSSMLSKK
jgi:Prohead core protein serine protease